MLSKFISQYNFVISSCLLMHPHKVPLTIFPCGKLQHARLVDINSAVRKVNREVNPIQPQGMGGYAQYFAVSPLAFKLSQGGNDFLVCSLL